MLRQAQHDNNKYCQLVVEAILGSLKELNDNLKAISKHLERLHLNEYIKFINSPYKAFFANFAWGLARGLGMAVGFTILGAILIYALKSIVWSNIPIIGRYIAELVKIVQNNL